MSILETFYILFKSDTTDVKKGVEEAEKSTRKLTDDLAKIDQGTQKIGKSFLELAGAAASFFGAAYAAHSIFSGITHASEQAADLGRVSQALGVNVEQLDAWGKAVQTTGGTTEGFNNSLKSLAEHLGGDAQIALKVLPQLADVFSKIGKIRSFQYGKQLGLDESTILLLQQGRREVEAQIARQKELGVVTKEDTEIGIKYKQSIQDTSNSFDNLYRILARDIVPIFTTVLEKVSNFVEYLATRKDFVIGTFIAIGVAVTAMAAPFIVANASIILMGIAVAALSLAFGIAYEDIKRYLNGQRSLVGEILEDYPKIGKAVREVVEVYKEFLDILKEISDFYPKLGEASASFFTKIGLGKDLEQKVGAYFFGADSSPFNGISSNSILNSSSLSRVQNINVGDITINTNSSDPLAIQNHFSMGFANNLKQTMNQFANGEAY